MGQTMGTDLNVRRDGGIPRFCLSRLAWVPIPVLLAALGVFRAADWQRSHPSIHLLLIVNIVFMLLACLVVAYLITRSFLIRSTPGLLLLGCGVVLWGPAGVVATVAAHGDANISITIYNSCLWLSVLCHLAGVTLSLRSERPLSPPTLWLVGGYTCAAGAVALVTLLALAGWIPAFYVEERGATFARQVVLASAIGMCALAALLLALTRRRPLSGFAYWYALALLLIATGLLGVMLQTHHASVLGWTGRMTQALGALYLFVAAVACVRESRVWGMSVETALRESEGRYRTLFETAPDAIIVHRDGRFLRANSAALRLSGAQGFEELAGHGVLDFFRPQEREQAAARIRLALTGRPQPIREATLRRLDGQEAVIELHTGPVDFEGAPAVQTILRDVTERKRAEETLRQSLRDTQQRCAETSALMTCTRAVLECRDLVSTARTVFNACRELLGAPAGYVAILARDGENNDVLFLEAGGLSCTVDPSLPMPVRGLRGEAYRTGRVVYENDFAHSRWAELLPPGHVRLENALFAPVVIDGRAVGLLGLGNKPGGFTDHDATLAATFGELIAIALRNSRALDSLRELNATLESKVAQRTAELAQRARQLQKLTLELSQAEERERRRIAVLLHEDLLQQMAAAKFHVNLLRNRAGDEAQREIVQQVDEMLKDTIEKSRRLSHDLSPAVLHLNDLGEVLQWLTKRVQAQHGLTVHVTTCGDIALPSEALTTFLFRAAEEVLFNVVKHAGVDEATLRARRLGRHVCLCISDTGRGFDPHKLEDAAGFGLLAIRERVELLGGRMKIRSFKDRGTAVRIVVPEARTETDTGLQSGNPEFEIHARCR